MTGQPECRSCSTCPGVSALSQVAIISNINSRHVFQLTQNYFQLTKTYQSF